MKVRLLYHWVVNDESGVLSFEWIVLAILLTIGVVGAMAAFRDAAVLKYGNVAAAAGHLDQSCSGSCLSEDFTDTRASQTKIVTAK